MNCLRVVVAIAAVTAAHAGIGPSNLSLVALSRDADLVIIATADSVSAARGQEPSIQLLVRTQIKGNAGAANLTVRFVRSPLMVESDVASDSIFVPDSLIGRSGLWFLKNNRSTIDVDPLAQGNYRWADVFLPVPAASVTGASPFGNAAIEKSVASFTLSWYESLQAPEPRDDDRLLITLRDLSAENALSAANALISSPLSHRHIIGLITAIDHGSDSAVAGLAPELDALSANQSFPALVATLASNYRVRGPSSIQALQALAQLHSTAPGLDASVSTVLQRAADQRSVYPVAVLLRDSRDAEAQLRASWMLGFYAMFCDKSGNLTQPGLLGPFADVARTYMPRAGSPLSPSEYAVFWKSWWSRNKATLGF